MENRFSKHPVTFRSNPPSPIETGMASTLTMTTYPSSGFHRDLPWHESRRDTGRRLQHNHEDFTLPSIKQVIFSHAVSTCFPLTASYQAIPEVLIPVDQDALRRRGSPATSPISARGFGLNAATPPEYVHSPREAKRRRLSLDGGRDPERTSQVPRLYASQSDYYQQSSPTRPRPSPEAWGGSNGSGLYATGSPSSPLRPLAANSGPGQAELRPTLPSLPFPHLAERGNMEMQRMRGYSVGEYLRESTGQPGTPYGAGYRPESGASAYTPADTGYGYPYTARNHSISLGSTRPYDRTPFSPGPYGAPYQDPYLPIRVGPVSIGAPGDTRQRKRRGNLPKETTDKLRSWFQAHLGHPYPTEDEKQELVRATGLQLSKFQLLFPDLSMLEYPGYFS